MIKQTADMLVGTDWRRVDTFLFEFRPKTKLDLFDRPLLPEVGSVFIPDILYYEEDGKYQCQIWLKIEDFSEFTDDASEQLLSKLKPFIDQDYTGNDIWINPDYPDGYSANHTL